MIRRARAVAGVLVVAVLWASGVQPVAAYLKFGVDVGGKQILLKWKAPTIQYFVTDQSIPGVSAADLQAAVGRAFATWEAVPTASIAYRFAGFTTSLPGEDDGRSTLGFEDRPDLEGVLASTSYLVDDNTGELLESDILFNSAYPWSVAPGGEPGHYDLETIALHEIGHFNGLGHSAIGETELSPTGRRVIATGAVMFPIAFGPGVVFNRVLRPDDIAGISDLYPDGGFASATGSLSGAVTLNGVGLFGAHVVAFSLTNGALIGNFALDELGQFSIGGLAPGPYVVRVEPIDDADVGSFFDPEIPVDVDFRGAFHQRLVIVPAGGDSGSIEIPVATK
jgi:hypothetical protein